MKQSANRTLIIAEAGVNHNGDLSRALALIEAAAKAGANAVKFQTFKTKSLVHSGAPKARYQINATGAAGGQFDMLQKLELDEAAHIRLVAACRDLGIEFLSTAFDEESLELLVNLGIRRIKVPSGEITNGPLLLKMARIGLPIIVSTGMATLDEIADTLAVFTWGFTQVDNPTSLAKLREYHARHHAAVLTGRVTVLQCSTAYPAPPESINLRAMDTLATKFGLPIGLSDHSKGITVSLAAVARGATVIEKHFTLDRSLPGPDHTASLEPDEFANMVQGIRTVELALGDGEKLPGEAESANIAVARRSLFAARSIAAGQKICGDDLSALRPATGISPMRYWDLLGCRAKADWVEGDQIRIDGINP